MSDDNVKPRFIETPAVDAVLSLDVVRDAATGEPFALLTIHHESGTTVRMPMSVAIAMRIWALLDQARIANSWPRPEVPIDKSELQ